MLPYESDASVLFCCEGYRMCAAVDLLLRFLTCHVAPVYLPQASWPPSAHALGCRGMHAGAANASGRRPGQEGHEDGLGWSPRCVAVGWLGGSIPCALAPVAQYCTCMIAPTPGLMATRSTATVATAQQMAANHPPVVLVVYCRVRCLMSPLASSLESRVSTQAREPTEQSCIRGFASFERRSFETKRACQESRACIHSSQL